VRELATKRQANGNMPLHINSTSRITLLYSTLRGRMHLFMPHVEAPLTSTAPSDRVSHILEIALVSLCRRAECGVEGQRERQRESPWSMPRHMPVYNPLH